ncbi:heterokaryon incompatibility protein-domain-containing protein [Diaporthe sp. PMI_573]|nr:heterokaryon incompatibility protein-domain-containing protein [Diaporthaceae sp. PMI_573]
MITASSQLCLRLNCQALDGTADDRRTPFSALSYCWNPLQQNPPSMHNIQIDDQDFPVAYNLYDALKRFEQKSLTEWLWIDAICINQQDDTEKTWQIQQMRGIYQSAETVYMWLGNSTASAQIMDFISEIGQEAVDCQGASMANPHDRHWNTSFYTLSIVTLNMGSPSGDDFFDAQTHLIVKMRDTKALWTKSPIAEGLRLILKNPYWTRVWVIQEVFLATNGVVISGGKDVPLQQLEETLGTIKFCGELFNIAPTDLPSSLLSIRSLELRRNHHNEHVSLKNILWQIEKAPQRLHYAVTYPRDLVLGLVGVLSLEEVEALSVDCSTTLKDMFIKVTRLFPRHERDDFTYWRENCTPHTESEHESLPTWVPDWATIGRDKHWPDFFRGDFEEQPNRREQPTLAYDSNISNDPVLRFGGFQVDRIEKVMTADLGPEPSDWSNDTTSADNWLQSVCEFADLDQVIEEGEVLGGEDEWKMVDEVLPSQVWQALNCISDGSWPFTPRLPKRIHRLCLKMIQREAIAAENLTKIEGLSIYAGILLAHENRGRTLFKTATGRIGLKPGDVITILWETKTTVILRKRNPEGWTFCGDSYVAGIMCGELIKDNISEEIFDIY